jgi:arabinan endo-1,5-alpha-L-arabinosidase
MIERGSYFYLFYSANGFADPNYSVGVARATSPLGPFVKGGSKILATKGHWTGPGHGSIVRGPSGGWVHALSTLGGWPDPQAARAGSARRPIAMGEQLAADALGAITPLFAAPVVDWYLDDERI